MAADPKLSWAGVQAAMDGFGAAMNSGYLRIYDNTGSVPTNADDSNNTNVLLAELRFDVDAFAACTGAGVLTANTITADLIADASGTPAYARYYASDGTTCMFQGTAGTASADFILDSATITAGQAVSCTLASLTGVRE